MWATTGFVGGVCDGPAGVRTEMGEVSLVWGLRNPGLGDGAGEGRRASLWAPAGSGL